MPFQGKVQFCVKGIKTSEKRIFDVTGGLVLPVIENFISHNECQGALRDGKDFKLLTKVELPGNPVNLLEDTPSTLTPTSSIQRMNQKMLEEDSTKDFTLVFSGTEISCHKVKQCVLYSVHYP